MVVESEVVDLQQYTETIVKPSSEAAAVVVASEIPIPVPDLELNLGFGDVSTSRLQLELRKSDAVQDVITETGDVKFIPTIRSGSFADIGHRRDMEDEHICIDDLSPYLDPVFHCTTPTPSAFYGVFDGHGGPEAAVYLRKHAMRFLFEEADFPKTFCTEDVFLHQVEESFRKSFLLADDALAEDCTIYTAGTTVLTALVFGRLLLVANVGDCRAVLCRNGEALEMSQDHRPIRASERRRVEECGGYFDDGYLNGVLSVTRALGDWDMKLPRGSSSPLIAEPEFMQTCLTEDDEFLIIGCDGIWDVMSSQDAVNVVRRGLRRHDDPEKCARELILEALRLKTIDNLTVIVVCFSGEQRGASCSSTPSLCLQPSRPARLRCCSLSAEALSNLRSWLGDGESS